MPEPPYLARLADLASRTVEACGTEWETHCRSYRTTAGTPEQELVAGWMAESIGRLATTVHIWTEDLPRFAALDAEHAALRRRAEAAITAALPTEAE